MNAAVRSFAPLRILLAGGGTGGHLFPGLAVADEIKRRVPNAEITFIGTKDKIEARVVPQRGYSFAPIWISGFRRKFSLGNLLFPLKVVTAIVQSFFLMKKLKPDVVVGTGGYACGPPLYVATLLGIPTLIQEQNSFPGVTTRKLASRVNEVHLTFETSKRFLSRLDNVNVSGNPTSAKFGTVAREEGAKYFSINPLRRTILVFGGSLGATSINKEIERILPTLMLLNMQVIWQTGATDFERLTSLLRPEFHKHVVVKKFIEQMEFGYAAADFTVCRAGATTLAELTRVGLPAILVPYPFAAADHQTENARAMVEANAAVMIKDCELEVKLLGAIRDLSADTTRLRRMAENAKRLGKPEAAATIANAVLQLAEAVHR
jgi:UDP-N-acetylglucosamine--N-acetylmuramyl-(pentapeptide) pyrophosphoryl-undecaprenol N-acetylglucosamine transferase